MDRSIVENWLAEGKVYDNFVGQLANTVKKEQSKNDNAAVTESEGKVDIAAMSRAAKSAFPPAVLQTNVESILGSAYDWLEGKTEKLVFNLDLVEEKAAFVEALGNEAVTKLSSLPTCTSEQISEDFDPFSATCLPSGTDINTQIAKLKEQITTSNEILPDTSVSADDVKVKVNGEDKRLDEAFSNAPKWFGWFKSSPLLLTALIIINGGLIVLLSRPNRNGLKKLAWLFGLVGIFVMLIGGSSVLVANQLGKGSFKIGGGQEGIADNLLVPLVKQVSSSVSTWNLIVGGAYLAIAVVCMVVYKVLKKKTPEVIAETTEEKNEEPKEPVKEVKTPPKIQ